MQIKTFGSPPAQYFLGARYVPNDRGYYIKCGNFGTQKRTRLHRDMWEHFNGPVPEGYVVHHKDHNRAHNALDNFELITKAEHDALTMRELMVPVKCAICDKEYAARKNPNYDYSICSKACEKRAAKLRQNPDAFKRYKKPITL